MFTQLIVFASLTASVLGQISEAPAASGVSDVPTASGASDAPGGDICVILKGVYCIGNWPFNDEEGSVCYNDGAENEAYCSYGFGDTACVICGLDENVVILDNAWCNAEWPDYDENGDVCANDGQADEAVCDFNFGPNACVVYDMSAGDVSEPDIWEEKWEAIEGFFEAAWDEVEAFLASCFSGNMEVVVQGKGVIPMEALQVGDYVKIGNDEVYERVYAFGHRVPDRVAEFVQIHTNAGNPLEMTSEHLVFVNGKTNPVRAGSVKVGDFLHAEGNNAVVQKIEVVTRTGIYNPLTSSGTIQVNGITASNYISFQKENDEYAEFQGRVEIMSHHDAAHVAMTPYRFYCTTLASCDTNNANSGMPFYVSMGIELIEWSKKQNILVQLSVYASFRMLLLASILMACAVFMIPVYIISKKLMHQLQGMVSFGSKSVVHINEEMKKE